MAIDTIKATAILDGAVDTADLADGAVTTAKITDGNITTAKIADGEVTDAKLATGISSSKLTGALPAIDGSSLTGVDPADGSITTAKLDSTLDLSGKTVTYGLSTGDMPNGTVINWATGVVGNESYGTWTISNTSNSLVDTGMNLTYDKQVSGSTVIGMLVCSFGSDDTAQRWIAEHKFQNDTGPTNVTNTPSGSGHFIHIGDDVNNRRDYYWYDTIWLKDTTSATGTQTYSWLVAAKTNSVSLRGGGIRYVFWEVI